MIYIREKRESACTRITERKKERRKLFIKLDDFVPFLFKQKKFFLLARVI